MSEKIIISVPNTFCAEEVGCDERVYVKKEKHDDKSVWAIYSPEGERMAQVFSHEMAMAIIRQNDLTAAQVH